MYEKTNREYEINFYNEEISRLSYLKDEIALKQHIESRKNELKTQIIKVQNSSINELVIAKCGRCEPKVDEETVRMELEAVKRFASEKPNSKYVAYGLTVKEINQISEQELFKLVEADLISNDKEIIDSWIALAKSYKDRYNGITPGELDEYVELLVQKEIIEDKIELRIAEIQLEDLKKHSLKKEAHQIVSIEELDLETERIKEYRKQKLGDFAKVLSIIGGASFVFMSATPLATGVDVLSSLIIGFSSSAAIIGLVSALSGTVELARALYNKKVVKKLKEEGIYDLYLEVAGLEKQIEEYEEKKGMVL